MNASQLITLAMSIVLLTIGASAWFGWYRRWATQADSLFRNGPIAAIPGGLSFLMAAVLPGTMASSALPDVIVGFLGAVGAVGGLALAAAILPRTPTSLVPKWTRPAGDGPPVASSYLDRTAARFVVLLLGTSVIVLVWSVI